jgi:DNA repair protein RecN (Recombination protein N)
MLDNIVIKDFALIEKVCVEWTPGLNVLTGETGAGKSVLIDALYAVLGGKTGSSAIRIGREKASIEATFICSPTVSAWLKQNELVDDGPSKAIVSREIGKSGSRVRINGTLVNHAMVQELGTMLLTIHAQHEAHTLMSTQYQMDMVDSSGDSTHKRDLEKLKLLYLKRKELQSNLKELNGSEDERLRRLDFARFQLQELEEAALTNENEDEELDYHQKILANAALLEELVNGAYTALNGGNDSEETSCAADLVQKSIADLEKASRFDEELKEIVNALATSQAHIEEAVSGLRRYASALDSDPQTLATVESRMAALVQIKRKYGPKLVDAIKHRDGLAEEIDRLDNSQVRVAELENELAVIQNDLSAAAEKLSERRKKIAQTLSQTIQKELSELGMAQCKFKIEVSETEEIGSSGQDRVEFLIAPNPGQPLMPLGKIASGGELSRIMLAIKSIFASSDQVSTVIFDEIDTGLSGKVLQSMRDKLARLAKSHQILCITHQPIIASVADNHIQVEKTHSENDTKVSTRKLSQDERTTALAAMASGEGEAEVALSFARALIDQANQLK